jgi:hypothetical protein
MSVTSRIEKAATILGIEPGGSAESMADLAWLASILSEDLELTQVEPAKPTPVDVGKRETELPVPHPSEQLTLDPPLDAPPKNDDPIDVFSRAPSHTADFVPATLVSIPAADALPARLAIERALKPFLKRFASPTSRELDLAATVDASAELQALSPVFRPVAERWFDVVLLVEISDAMELWSETIRQLHALMERHGAFRAVRTLFYEVSDGTVVLRTVGGQSVKAHSIADPDGRRLCLFLTNGVSSNWARAPLDAGVPGHTTL